MPAYRCRRHLMPAHRRGLLFVQTAAASASANAARQTFWESKIMRLFAMACLSVSTLCAVAGTQPSPSSAVTLEQLHSRAALVGQEVEVVSCAAVPVSDAPTQENLIVIYPCATELSEETSKVAVLGRLSAQTVLKPTTEWAIGDSPAFKGRFRGLLKREAIDPDEEEKVLVIELDEAEFYSAIDL